MTRAAVGKKKKIIVYTKGSKKKDMLIPVMLVGGILIFYFINKSKAQTTVVPTPVPDPTVTNPGSGGQVILPGGDVINTNPTGYNQVIPVYTTPVSTAVTTTMSAVGKQYFNSLQTVVTDKAWLAAFQKMTDNELYYSWWYVANYLSHGIPLLKQTRLLPTGQWDNSNPGNAELYNAVQAIHTKYGIF